MLGQRELQGPAHETGYPLIQGEGSVSPELGIHYSPIYEGSHSPWFPGSSLQSLHFDVGSPVDNDKMGSDQESQTFQVLTT